jgi:hypothetical protein
MKTKQLFKSLIFSTIACFSLSNPIFGQGTSVLEMDYQAVIPPAGPSIAPITIPFSLDVSNNNAYTTPTNPISVTVSLRNQAFKDLTYSNVSTGITFGGGATLSSGFNGDTVQKSASNVPFDLLGTYSSNGGPKSFMFTSNPNDTGVLSGQGFDVDGDLFTPNQNGGVQLFTAAQVLFDNNTPKDARVYFGDIVFTFSQPVRNPVLHFAGLGGSYSFLPLTNPSLPNLAANYLSTFFSSELELVNTGITSTKLSSNPIMSLVGNNIINNLAKPNGNSTQITGEFPIDNYGAMTGSIRLNGVVQEVVYKVYLKGSSASNVNWSSKGMNKATTPYTPLITGATRDPFTGDIWWAAASFLEPPAGISGIVFNDKDSLLDNNIRDNNGVPNERVNPNNSLFANLIGSTNNVVASVPVGSDGSYLFEGVPNGNYSVQISTFAGTPGTGMPITVLPASWTSTGEKNGLGTGSDP